LFSANIELKKIKEDLFVLSYANVFPANQKFALLFWLNEFFVFRRIKRFMKKRKLRCEVFWSFDPYRLINPAKICSELSIFHYADEYSNRYFSKILGNVDYILSISDYFLQKNIPKQKGALVLQHSLCSDFFMIDEKHPLSVELKGKAYAIFIGSIDHRIDFDVLRALVEQYSDLEFILAGPVKWDRIFNKDKALLSSSKPANISLVGVVPFIDLKYYIAHAKVCLAPMAKKVEGNAINHQKLIQYLSWGKPIISPMFHDFKSHSDLLYVYEDLKTGLEVMDAALHEKEDDLKQKRRIDFSKQFTFEEQLLKIEEYIN
jgi:hypothetical protein